MKRRYPNQTVLCYNISQNITKHLVVSEPAYYLEDMCLERLMKGVLVHGRCIKCVRRSGEVGWERPNIFDVLQNSSEMFGGAQRCSETYSKVWRCSYVFRVCLRKCEWWLCLYEALCDVFSELGPVGGPINLPLTKILTVPVSSTKCARSRVYHKVMLKIL
jgi:hypothetical protein